MSGATDRREDEQVPQFYGGINEKFAECETDVRLWQVEFKVEDRERWGPRLYRRGFHRQPKVFVKMKLGTEDVAQFTVDNIIQCLKDNGYGELLEELGQEASDNYFHMRQGKAESIQDYIFSVKKFSLLPCKGHNHRSRRDNPRLLADENVGLAEREISGIKIITQGQTQLAKSREPISRRLL